MLLTTAPAEQAALDAALHELRLELDGLESSTPSTTSPTPEHSSSTVMRTTMHAVAANEAVKAQLRARIQALVQLRDPSTAPPSTTRRPTTTRRLPSPRARSNATRPTHKGPMKLPYLQERLRQNISAPARPAAAERTTNGSRAIVSLSGVIGPAVPAHGIIDAELGPRNVRQRAVVDAFRWAWQGYKRCAWGQDYLQPRTCKGLHVDGAPQRSSRSRRGVVPARPDHH